MKNRYRVLIAAVLVAALVVPAGLSAAHQSSQRPSNGDAAMATAVDGGWAQSSSNSDCCAPAGECSGQASCAVAPGCSAPVFLPSDAPLPAPPGDDHVDSGAATLTPIGTVRSEPTPPPRG